MANQDALKKVLGWVDNATKTPTPKPKAKPKPQEPLSVQSIVKMANERGYTENRTDQASVHERNKNNFKGKPSADVTIKVNGKNVTIAAPDGKPISQDEQREVQEKLFAKQNPEGFKQYQEMTKRLKSLPDNDPAKGDLNIQRRNLLVTGKADKPLQSGSTDPGVLGNLSNKVDDLANLYTLTHPGGEKIRENISNAIMTPANMAASYMDKIESPDEKRVRGDSPSIGDKLKAAAGFVNPADMSLFKLAADPAKYNTDATTQALDYQTDPSLANRVTGAMTLAGPAIDLVSMGHGITSQLDSLAAKFKPAVVKDIAPPTPDFTPTVIKQLAPENPSLTIQGKPTIKVKAASRVVEDPTFNPYDGSVQNATTQKPLTPSKTPQIEPQAKVGSKDNPFTPTVVKDKFAASNLASADQRVALGDEPRVKSDPITRKSLESNSVDVDATHQLAKNIVKDVEEGKPARPISAQQQTDLGRATAQSSKELLASKKTLADAIKAKVDTADLERIHNDLVDRQLTLRTANEYSGSETSATMRSRNYAYTDLDSPDGVYNEGVIKKRGDLTPQEHDKLTNLTDTVAESNARIKELEAHKADLQKTIDSYKEGGKQPNSVLPVRRIARSDIEIQASRKKSLDAVKKSLKSQSIGSGLGAYQDLDLKALAEYSLTFVEQGVGKVEDIVALATKSLNEQGVPVTPKHVEDALVQWATPKKVARELDRHIMLRDRARKEIRQALDELGKSKSQVVFNEAISLSRAMQATLDMSATLRQGLITSARHPVLAAKSFKKALHALADPIYHSKIHHELFDSPMAVTRKRAGLYIADKGGLNLGEEAFMGHWLDKAADSKIPILKQFGQISQASERHYETFLNQLRASVFDDAIARMPDMPLADQKALANFINVATGRGQAAGGVIGKIANTALFSPRFVASRIEAPFHMLSKSPVARKEAIQSFASLLGAGATVGGLAKLAGGDVSLDPESPDFGKVRFGNTRFDIWGGEIQPLRLFARIAKRLGNKDQAKYSQGTPDLVAQFLRYKASPIGNTVIGAFDRKDAIGKPMFVNAKGEMTAGTISEDVIKQFIPLVAKDITEVTSGDIPIPIKAIGVPAAILGIGVNTYAKKPSAPKALASGMKGLKKLKSSK